MSSLPEARTADNSGYTTPAPYRHTTKPGFRLYNVSGLDAVELRLKSHEVRRIGTDDPQGLVEALKSARRGL